MEQSISVEPKSPDPKLKLQIQSSIGQVEKSVETPVGKFADSALTMSFVSMLKEACGVAAPHWKKQFELAVKDAKIAESIILAYLPLYKNLMEKKRVEVLGNVVDKVSPPGPRKKAPLLEQVFSKSVDERFQAARLEGANLFDALALGLMGGDAGSINTSIKESLSEKFKSSKIAKMGAITIGRWLADKLTGNNLYTDVPKPLKDITSVTFYFFPDTWLAVPLWQLNVNIIKAMKETGAIISDVKPIITSYIKQKVDAMKSRESQQAAQICLQGTALQAS